jgi:hypothetical protein
MIFEEAALNETEELRFLLKVELTKNFLEVGRSVGSDWTQKSSRRAI